MSLPKRAQAAVVAVLATAALTSAACSSNNSSGSGTTSNSVTSTTAPSSTSSTSSTSAGLANCAASGMSTTVVGSQGAAGTIELTLQFKNTSPNTCVLNGYPGAQLYNSSGGALPTTVVRGGMLAFDSFGPSQVTLAPGAASFFNMGYSDVQSGNQPCSAASSLWITPPNAVDHAVVSQKITACPNGQLNVSPVFSSTSAQTQTTAP